MKFIKNIEKSGQKIISSILGIYYSIRFTLINKSTPKIPPAHLIARVDGQYGTVHFLKVSIVSWKTIIKSLRRVGININDFKNILDFGCGVARTLISANSQIKKTNFFGTDVDREAIEWCKKNIKNVFLMTGGAISFMIDAFSRTKKINYTCVAHEQAAAMMADAYSRLGPNLSCTMATSGPGATNLITGIACSWFDSIPSIHITGQVNSYEKQGAQKGTKNTRQIGFQETDIVSIAKPITKFSYQLKNPNEIKYVLGVEIHELRSCW